MTFGLSQVLLIVALVLFVLAALATVSGREPAARWPLTPVGFAFLTAGILVGSGAS